ncbi:YaaR family protein [Terrilactibacillus sp. S3-3]|nr:YaaR family protein [Terrilactibacillus sp. S3-3]
MAKKISQETQMKETMAKRPSLPAKPSAAFQTEITGQKETLQMHALKELLGKVDEQAKRVAASRTIKDVQVYKKYIRTFMQEAIRFGLGTKRSSSWQQGGAEQTLVKKVDEKLVSLTDDILNKNADELQLLDKLGEIRGLIINLYI